MNAEYAQKLLKDSNYQAYGRHDLMISMSCVFEDDCGDTEIVFAVPIEWLRKYIRSEWKEEWDYSQIQKWLQEEYTSEDSEEILEHACLEDKVAFYNVDYHDFIPF